MLSILTARPECQGDPFQYPSNYRTGSLLLAGESGCFGCHPDEENGWERIGPSLDFAASKLDRTWIVRWLQNPKDYLPQGNMPVFEVSSNEAEGMAAYLIESSSSLELAKIDPLAGDMEEGERQFHEIGCVGCHSLQPKGEDSGPDHGPNLSEIMSKTNPSWIYHWLLNPSRFNPRTKMPNLRLTEREALDLTAFLSTMGGQAGKTDGLEKPEVLSKIAIEGKEWIEKNGCQGCHSVNGFEGSKGIATRPIEWDEGFAVHLASATGDRISPRYDHLSSEEIETLSIFCSTPEEIIETQRTPTEQALFEGHRVIRRYNCTGCHQVEKTGEDDYWGGDIQTTISDPSQSPPLLVGEGKKVQANWLRTFLSKVEPIRPWLTLRMPTFPFNDEELTGVVDYFRASAGKDLRSDSDPTFDNLDPILVEAGMHIFHGFQCISCHPVTEEMVEAIPDKSTLAPNLSLVPARLQYEWIGEWILDPNKIQPGTKMPSFFIEGQSFAHMMVNQPKNEKIKEWFDAHYPGEEQMRLLSDTRWVIGAMQAFLWKFDAETFLSRFPWTPPPAPATPTEDLSEDFSDDFE